MLTRSFGTHDVRCFYSVTDDTLVAAPKQNDVNFCDGSTPNVTGGVVPTASCTPDSLAPATCPHENPNGDAGVNGG